MKKKCLSTYSVLFVGYLFPNYLEDSILDQPIPPAQTQRFGAALLEALSTGFEGNIQVLSVAPLLDFPKSKFLVAPRAKWNATDAIPATMIPYINVTGLKHLTRFIGTFFHTLMWAIRHRSSKRVIVMHGVQSCKIWGVLLACIFMPSLTVSFLTDDLGLPLKWEGKISRMIRRLDVFLMKTALQKVSGVIAMTLPLAAKLAPGRPVLIIPAIHNALIAPTNHVDVHGKQAFTIGYFGGLKKEYGVDLLLSAFELANRDDWILLIGGRGELQPWVEERAAADSRIKYLGFLSREEMNKTYQNVDVLVNPRLTSTSIASLSFPSKLVEYLGTGKPVVTTDLPTLDEEFREHLIVMQMDSPEELVRCLDQVSSWQDDRYESWRAGTLVFVENNLSPMTQGKKIRCFIDSLSCE